MLHTYKHNKVDRRFLITIGIFIVLLVLLFVLHVGLGTVWISPKDVISALFNRPAAEYQRWIVWNLRLPRSLIAMYAGAMLGLAGSIMQALTRNPLAEPSLTGVTSGSILGIVCWLGSFPLAAKYEEIIPFAALAGGMLTVVMMYLVTRRMRDNPFVLILKGIIMSAVLSSIASLILLQNQEQLPTVMLWMIGSLNAKVWQDWFTIWPWAVVSLPLGIACYRAANVLQLGEEVPIGLGFRLQRTRILLFVVSALLTAGAVSVAGAISFIGLIGPHIARRLVGQDSVRVFPTSVLVGGCLLLFADMLAQSVTIGIGGKGSGLPVGALTAMLGAPFFLYLLRRSRR
ncbi:MAG: iron ABC transporter permease [Alicyclobacillus sp.]|nr:iron ABC transporter permease [Alicyclobacillus sp.]